MMPAKRPLSPHLQVYRPQITSVLSILHRFTGIALSGASLLFVTWLSSLACDVECFNTFNLNLAAFPLNILMLGFVFSLYFHLFNGARHLAWDLGFGFSIESTTFSGWLVVASTIACTCFTYFFFF